MWFDLDDDGIDELLVTVGDLSNCGTDGCSMSFLKRDGDAFANLKGGIAYYLPNGSDLIVRLMRNDDGAWVNY